MTLYTCPKCRVVLDTDVDPAPQRFGKCPVCPFEGNFSLTKIGRLPPP